MDPSVCRLCLRPSAWRERGAVRAKHLCVVYSVQLPRGRQPKDLLVTGPDRRCKALREVEGHAGDEMASGREHGKREGASLIASYHCRALPARRKGTGRKSKTQGPGISPPLPFTMPFSSLQDWR